MASGSEIIIILASTVAILILACLPTNQPDRFSGMSTYIPPETILGPSNP